jgi:hypothetical protein
MNGCINYNSLFPTHPNQVNLFATKNLIGLFMNKLGNQIDSYQYRNTVSSFLILLYERIINIISLLNFQYIINMLELNTDRKYVFFLVKLKLITKLSGSQKIYHFT